MQDDKRIQRTLAIERKADTILGRRLASARAQCLMPLEDLAHVLGLTVEEILDHEQGSFSLTAVRLAWLAPVLNLDLSTFLKDLPEPPLIAGLRAVPPC